MHLALQDWSSGGEEDDPWGDDDDLFSALDSQGFLPAAVSGGTIAWPTPIQPGTPTRGTPCTPRAGEQSDGDEDDDDEGGGSDRSSGGGTSGQPAASDRPTPPSPQLSKRSAFLLTQAAGPSDGGDEDAEGEGSDWGSFLEEADGPAPLETQHLVSIRSPVLQLRKVCAAGPPGDVYSQIPTTDDDSYESSFVVSDGSEESPAKEEPTRKRRRIATRMAASSSDEGD